MWSECLINKLRVVPRSLWASSALILSGADGPPDLLFLGTGVATVQEYDFIVVRMVQTYTAFGRSSPARRAEDESSLSSEGLLLIVRSGRLWRGKMGSAR